MGVQDGVSLIYYYRYVCPMSTVLSNCIEECEALEDRKGRKIHPPVISGPGHVFLHISYNTIITARTVCEREGVMALSELIN